MAERDIDLEELIEIVTKKVLQELGKAVPASDKPARRPETRVDAVPIPAWSQAGKTPSAPAAKREGAERKKQIITEKTIKDAHRRGATEIQANKGDIVTPLAREALRKYKITIKW